MPLLVDIQEMPGSACLLWKAWWGYTREIKKLQACKPDSVIPAEPGRLSFIWLLYRYSSLAANPRISDEQSSGIRLFGISARKVYPPAVLPQRDVGSYPTFSPLSASGGRLFSVALSVSFIAERPHPLGGALLCAVRTFLPILLWSDNPACSLCKDTVA